MYYTTISGVRTEVTRKPYPTNGGSGNGPSNGDGNGSIDGGGGGSGGTSKRGGLNHGIIAAIVICALVALGILVFFLRKRVRMRRAARHTRWQLVGENARRDTFRSSFGDLRASIFGFDSEIGHDNAASGKRYSGPFSDSMAVPLPSPTSPNPSAPQMTQITNTEITPPAIAVHSTGKRGSRNSQFSIGSAESGESDGSGIQWVEIRPEVSRNGDGQLSPTDFCLPSPMSVRPFTPTESWSFPKPPTSRGQSMVSTFEDKGFVGFNPFADPVPQPSSSTGTGLVPVEMVTRTFEPKGTDELAVEVGDEVSVLRTFDDGWGKVKVLKRSGSTKSVQGLEGFIPVDCFRPKGNKDPLFTSADMKLEDTQRADG